MRHGVATSRGWWGQSVVVVMVLATGALGFCCLFDGDNHDGQGSSPDLCLTLLSLSSAPPLLAGLLLQGRAAETAALPVRSAWMTVLTPPPRSLSLFA